MENAIAVERGYIKGRDCQESPDFQRKKSS